MSRNLSTFVRRQLLRAFHERRVFYAKTSASCGPRAARSRSRPRLPVGDLGGPQQCDGGPVDAEQALKAAKGEEQGLRMGGGGGGGSAVSGEGDRAGAGRAQWPQQGRRRLGCVCGFRKCEGPAVGWLRRGACERASSDCTVGLVVTFVGCSRPRSFELYGNA
eukprot:2045767-Pleurochrysis_carterae.AAC.2